MRASRRPDRSSVSANDAEGDPNRGADAPGPLASPEHPASKQPTTANGGSGDGGNVDGSDERLPIWKQRRVWIIAGAFCVSLATSLLAIAPLVRAKVESKAASIGLTMSIGAVRPGFGVIRLLDVSVSSPAVPGARALLDCVEVTPTLGLRPRLVLVQGGRVEIDRSVTDLLDDIDAARARTGAADANKADGSSLELYMDGVDLVWKTHATHTQRAWGLAYARAGGEDRLSVDLARATWDGGSLEVREGRVALARLQGKRVIRSVSSEHFLAVVDLSGLDADELIIPKPAAAVVSKQPTGVPARPAPGFVERPAGAALRRQFARLASGIASVMTADGHVELRGVRAELRRDDQSLNLGPGKVVVSRDRSRARVSFVPGAAVRRSPLTFRLDVPFAEGPVKLDVDGGPVHLSALGVQERDMGLIDVHDARLDLKASLELAANGDEGSFSGYLQLSQLAVHHPKLAARPVRGIQVGLNGRGAARLDGSKLEVTDVELQVGRVKAKLVGQFVRDGQDAAMKFAFQMPLVACHDLFESTPRTLVPLLDQMQFEGTFSLSSDLEFDTRRPKETKVDWTLANDCRISAVPANIHPNRFRGVWQREVEGAGDEPLIIDSGPGSAGWVPLHDISRHVETAVIVCEDSRFWSHEGFDHKAIRESIIQNLVAGRFVRGASTIPMQLAKNLYLNPQKTLSRKLEEAVLTMLLEQELSKEQIMELYLNVIEFGPGIYGIERAAQHYFHTNAMNLSLGQSLYLGSILPNPSRQHFGSDGVVTERWMQYLHRLMSIAHKIRRITDEELEAGLQERIEFGEAYSPGDPFAEDGVDPSRSGLPLDADFPWQIDPPEP